MRGISREWSLGFFTEQLLSRTTDCPLYAIPAGQLSPHKSIAKETQEEEGNDEHEDRQGKILYQEYNACKNRDNKHQKIRNNIFPGDLFLVKLLRLAPGKEPGAQIPFTKSTGFTVIVTIHAMSAHQPEFEEKYEKQICDDPEETELIQDICANNVDQE
jgi:hypothetical protein